MFDISGKCCAWASHHQSIFPNLSVFISAGKRVLAHSCNLSESICNPLWGVITSELTVKHGPPASTVSSTTDPGTREKDNPCQAKLLYNTRQYAKAIKPKNHHGEKDPGCLQVSHKRIKKSTVNINGWYLAVPSTTNLRFDICLILMMCNKVM